MITLKSLFGVAVIAIFSLSMKGLFAEEANERGAQLSEEFLSIESDSEATAFLHNLSQEDKDLFDKHQIAEVQRLDAEFDQLVRNAETINSLGTLQILDQIREYLKAATKSALGQISDDPSRREAEKLLYEEKLEKLRRATIQNSGFSNIEIWKQFEPKLEVFSAKYPWKTVNEEQLKLIYSNLFDPLMRELETALKEGTDLETGWMFREGLRQKVMEFSSNGVPPGN